MYMWFAERQCRGHKEHDWRADGFDKYSARICSHADRMVYWINIRVNAFMRTFAHR